MKSVKNSLQAGFTLIELLVVVAIIGILAAVGVVAYSGYTESAQENTIKTNHASVVKFISAEFAKCQMNSAGTAYPRKANGVGTACVTINAQANPASYIGSGLIGNAGRVFDQKNPLNSAAFAVRWSTASNGAANRGYVNLFQVSGTVMGVRTCFKKTYNCANRTTGATQDTLYDTVSFN